MLQNKTKITAAVFLAATLFPNSYRHHRSLHGQGHHLYIDRWEPSRLNEIGTLSTSEEKSKVDVLEMWKQLHRTTLTLLAKEPLVGKIYELNSLKKMHIDRLEKGEIIVRIHTLGGKKVKLRLSGDEAVAWAAKLINVRDQSLGHRTHPNVDFSVQKGVNSNELLDNQENATFASKASSSASKYSKFSYSITLNDSTESEDDSIGTMVSHNRSLLNGDVPSMLGSAKFGITERARGGKVQEDFSELIYSIVTSSSNTSFDRDVIRRKVDELIKRHIQEEERKNAIVLMNTE